MDPSETRRKRVEIVLVETHAQLRTTIRGAMLREGYGKVEGITGFDELSAILEHGLPDLVIVDFGIAEIEHSARTIRNLRHSRIGHNPFIPVMVTAWESSPALVRQAVDAGIDDFLVKPLAPKHILDRIQVLVKARKPFVVTSDYIGPDRRKDPGRGSSIDSFEVPNSLRAKELEPNWDPDAFHKSIETVRETIAEEKLRRTAFQVAFLITLIVSDYEGGILASTTAEHLRRFGEVARDLARRLPGTPFAGATEICVGVQQMAKSIEAGSGPSSKDMQLLPLLAKAIVKAVYPKRDEEALARDIAQAVAGYRARLRRAVAA